MELLEFDTVQWDSVIRTSGNPHDALVGIIISWWTTRSGNCRALVSYPYCDGQNAQRSDGLLCVAANDGYQRKALLEVEWENREDRLIRLTEESERLQEIPTRILVLYRYHNAGDFHGAVEGILNLGKERSRNCEFEVIIIIIDKSQANEPDRLRDTDVYRWTVSCCKGYKIENGVIVENRIFYSDR